MESPHPDTVSPLLINFKYIIYYIILYYGWQGGCIGACCQACDPSSSPRSYMFKGEDQLL